MSHNRVRFVPEADVKYSGITDEDGEPSDGELPVDFGAGSPHMTAQPSMLFLLSINSFGFSYGMTVSTLGLVILPSEAIYLYHDRCVRRLCGRKLLGKCTRFEAAPNESSNECPLHAGTPLCWASCWDARESRRCRP